MQEAENAKDAVTIIVTKVSGYVDAIAAKLGVASEALWEILIRQMYIEGFGYLGFFLLFGSIFGLSLWGFKKGLGMKSTNSYDTDARDVTLIFSCIGGVLSFILGTIFAWNALVYLANPEYQALMMIVKAVK